MSMKDAERASLRETEPVHPADRDPSVPRAGYGDGGAETYEAVTGKCFICRTKCDHLSIAHYPDAVQEQFARERIAYMKASAARVGEKLNRRFAR
jgi:hypothetical protein